jgi:hypothetical protein
MRRLTGRWLAWLLSGALLSAAACQRSTLPPALTDHEFWSLSEALSEPPGSFSVSDNIVSNEPLFAESVRRLRPLNGVYVGVGPEQNFSYIARVQPTMAFIVDIRRENRNLHLFYKALFELSTDRADFVSRLFSRSRPATLPSTAAVDEIFAAYAAVPPSRDIYDQTAALIRQRLLETHHFPLSTADLEWIDRVFKAFFTDGPEIQFWGDRPGGDVRPSYRELMTARDYGGNRRSFLATDEAFRFVKDLHGRNLIVPVVGDFGGPSAIRHVGDYVRERHDVITAFYASNVAVYLTNEQTRAFCGNLAALPASGDAWFIESKSLRTFASKLRACAPERR